MGRSAKACCLSTWAHPSSIAAGALEHLSIAVGYRRLGEASQAKLVPAAWWSGPRGLRLFPAVVSGAVKPGLVCLTSKLYNSVKIN